MIYSSILSLIEWRCKSSQRNNHDPPMRITWLYHILLFWAVIARTIFDAPSPLPPSNLPSKPPHLPYSPSFSPSFSLLPSLTPSLSLTLPPSYSPSLPLTLPLSYPPSLLLSLPPSYPPSLLLSIPPPLVTWHMTGTQPFYQCGVASTTSMLYSPPQCRTSLPSE